MKTGETRSVAVSNMQQNRMKWNRQNPNSKISKGSKLSLTMGKIVSKAPSKNNILISAPHSAKTYRLVGDEKREGKYKKEPHLAEKLTYHLVLRLADKLGAGVVAWNDDQRLKKNENKVRKDPSYLNSVEQKTSAWRWIAKSYKDYRMPKGRGKRMHIDIHQQGTSGNNDLELGFDAMKATSNRLYKKFRNRMTEKLREVICKYSYGTKRAKVVNQLDNNGRNGKRFGGNGTPIPKEWKRIKSTKENFKACYARQTQDLGYDLSVQFELTNPLIQELIGNEPFFEEFWKTILSVYKSM